MTSGLEKEGTESTENQERLRNFKELQAKFQKLDMPSLPGPIELPVGVSQNGDIGSTQSPRIRTSGKRLSSSHSHPPPYCSSGERQPPTLQEVKLAQRADIQKCSGSPGPRGRSTCSAVNPQKASLLSGVSQSNTKLANKKTLLVNSSFRDKLWNWEKFSSPRSELSSAVLLANHGSRAFRLEDQEGKALPSPEEPRKRLGIKGSLTVPSQGHLIAKRRSHVTQKEPTLLLSQHGRESLEESHPKRSPAGSTCQPIYESALAGPAPEKQLDVKHHQLPKMKPLPSMESLGPPPVKPPKPPAVNLQPFQRQTAAVPKPHREGHSGAPKGVPEAESQSSADKGRNAGQTVPWMEGTGGLGTAAVEEGCLPPESANFEEPHNYEETISYQRHFGDSINLCTAEEIADSTYEVRIKELQKPSKIFLHQELSPRHENENQKMKEKEPCDLEPQKTEEDLYSDHLFKAGGCAGTPGKLPVMKVRRPQEGVLTRGHDAVTDNVQTKACPADLKLARHFRGQCGYVEALEVTKETRGRGAFKASPTSEVTYDDVEYPGRTGSELDFSNSFASDSEENSKEIYEDIYKTKSNSPKIDFDGKTLKRLQRFFKKEKERFKMKRTKSKENVSAFSISLPELELSSQKVIHDEVNISEKESTDEDKVKIRKFKFFKPKGKKDKNGAEDSESLSPRNFFRIKKQNLERKRMEREKLFRERFEYDKEITVINTAVACSSNSRNGMFDLPITPGEELEVIDITEENLVVCRNSQGKYGYVLIEHLNFKHRGWSP